MAKTPAKKSSAPKAKKAPAKKPAAKKPAPAKKAAVKKPASATKKPATKLKKAGGRKAKASHQDSPEEEEAEGGGTVNPASGLVGKGHVLIEAGEALDVNLALTDVASNANKFYRLQVVEATGGAGYWLVQHWGRIGTAGQTQVKEFPAKATALKEFHKKFKSKAGVEFANRATATGAGGKYRTLTEQRVAAAGGRIADAGTISFSLSWDAAVDLDLHCAMPDGTTCCFRSKTPAPYISLDVDKMANDVGSQVENIILETSSCPDGKYVYSVKYYSGQGEIPFTVVCNQFGKKINEGSTVATTPTQSTKCLELHMIKGKVVSSKFAIKTKSVKV